MTACTELFDDLRDHFLLLARRRALLVQLLELLEQGLDGLVVGLQHCNGIHR